MNRAVFLDRDGVLVEDRDLLTRPEDFRVLPGVPEALTRLAGAGYKLLMVTNQPVVARGLLSEPALQHLHDHLARLLHAAGAPPLDAIYYCPHHPRANLPGYRLDCTCRKPRPGLLLAGIEAHHLDPAACFMVGDRLSDIAAGARAGCRTVLVESGMHQRPPIQSAEPPDPGLQPDHTCPSLAAAADWILARPLPAP